MTNAQRVSIPIEVNRLIRRLHNGRLLVESSGREVYCIVPVSRSEAWKVPGSLLDDMLLNLLQIRRFKCDLVTIPPPAIKEWCGDGSDPEHFLAYHLADGHGRCFFEFLGVSVVKSVLNLDDLVGAALIDAWTGNTSRSITYCRAATGGVFEAVFSGTNSPLMLQPRTGSVLTEAKDWTESFGADLPFFDQSVYKRWANKLEAIPFEMLRLACDAACRTNFNLGVTVEASDLCESLVDRRRRVLESMEQSTTPRSLHLRQRDTEHIPG